MQPPGINQQPKRPGQRRRLSVEVYFVLYLTAIMLLLLGTAPLSDETYDAELEEAIAQLINTDFDVEVEHIALLVPFIPAGMQSDSMPDVRYDTANRVLAHGSFSQVEFRLVSIEDTLSGAPIPIEQATFFPEGDSSAVFIWNPQNTTRSAVYRVRVEAQARPAIPSSVTSPTLRQRIESIVTRRNALRDTATFTINVVPIHEYQIALLDPPMTIDTTGMSSSLPPGFDYEQLIASLGREGDFGANAWPPSVRVPPGSTWEAGITVFGISPKEVELSLPPDVKRTGESGTQIIVSGTASSVGDRQIQIGVRSKKSDVTKTVSFNVITSNLDDPKSVPLIVYPESTYRIDFSSDGVNNSRISVNVEENGAMIRRDQGAIMEYSPRAGSGDVVFTRLLDGKPVGSYRAKIKPIPDPVIRPIEEKPCELIVETITYGTINGRQNIPTFRMMEGNAFHPEEIGEPVVDNIRGSVTQRWVIKCQNPSREFRFRAKAWDLRGMARGEDFSYAP